MAPRTKIEIIGGVVIAVLIALLLSKCNKGVEHGYTKNTDVAKPIERTKDNKGREHAVQETEKVTDQNVLVAQLQAENSRLRMALATVKIHTETAVKEIPVPYAVHDTLRDSNAIQVPKRIHVDTAGFHIDETLTKQRVIFDSISFSQNLTVSFGKERRKNLWDYFKPAPIKCEVISDNRYSTTTGMRSFYYQSVTPFLLKRVPLFIEGAATGYFLSKIK